SSYGTHLDLHSFPTRRSSDLSNEKNLRAYTGNGTRMMIRVVFVIVLPLRHQTELVKGLIRAQKPDLAGRVACRGEQQKPAAPCRSEEHTSELQSLAYLVCRLL